MTAYTLKVAVIGARRRREGTGEYIAREFARLGCEVRAIVGASDATIEETRHNLRERYGIRCVGYRSLAALLDEESVDAVAICSPPEVHLPQLESAVEAGCHVFCEKPLWWPPCPAQAGDAQAGTRAIAERLVDDAKARGRYLAVNTQWPYTLDSYRQLHPKAYGGGRPVERFRMELAPTSRGARMVVDSGSHLLSMLYALAGPGELDDIQANFESLEKLSLIFGYRHARGEIAAELRLERWPAPPRPAGYSINGRGVERRVELPAYLLSLVANDNRIPIRDPLAASVEDFVRRASAGEKPDRNAIVAGMTQLQALVTVAESMELV